MQQEAQIYKFLIWILNIMPTMLAYNLIGGRILQKKRKSNQNKATKQFAKNAEKFSTSSMLM